MNTSVIYRPRGKALEYAELAANLYTGCTHGCTYCYAPTVLHTNKDAFSSVKPRMNIMSKLKRDAEILNQDLV